MKALPALALSLAFLFIGLFSDDQPVQAAIQRSADFPQGHAIGVGMFGLAYDYGIGALSIGSSFSGDATYSLSYSARIRPALRALWRFMEMEGLSAGVLAGIQFDPGTVGGRAYLTPDLGVGLAYNFHILEIPMAFRLNLTLALGPGSRASYPDTTDQPTPNLFQRLTIGPLSSMELALMPTQNLEITLGGGTWLGMRIKL